MTTHIISRRQFSIGAHFVALLLVATLPLVVFAGVMTALFWQQQREAFEQRYLERVRAMSIALDRGWDGHMRVLQALAHSEYLATGDLPRFYEQAKAVRAEQPGWATVILIDTSATQLMNLRRPFGAALPKSAFGEAAAARVVATGQPVITPLIKGKVSGDYTTNIGVPVRQNGAVTHILIAAIDPHDWLDFLRRYPVAPEATLTLLDQDGIVIARTLNPERWIGKQPAPALYEKSRAMPEGAYRSIGLEGQWFYSAHSRSALSGWTVATGVPAAGVEAELWRSTLATVGGALLCLGLAAGLAYVFSRRIAQSIARLARSAAQLGSNREAPAPMVSSIREVSETSRAFTQAAAFLRQREEKLRQSEEQFRALANSIPNLAWWANADGYITWYNQRWYDYTGTTPEQMEGWGWQSVHDPGVLPEVLARWKASIATGEPFDMEFPLRGADGVFRPFLTRVMPLKDSGGKVLRWFGANTDVSERKRAEVALQESEERARRHAGSLQAVLDTARTVILIARDPECRSITGNRAAYEFLRVPFGEDLSKTGPASERLAHYRVFHDDVELAARDMPIQRVAASGVELSNYEMKFVFSDGVVRWLLGDVRPSFDEAHRSIGAVAAFVEISKRKGAEDALKRRSEELEAARSSAERATADAEKASRAKDEFLAVLSHELRTPLTPVLAAVGLMQRQPGMSADTNRSLEIIRRNIQLQARLIDDLLDLTGITQGKLLLKRKPIDICTVIDRAVEIAKPDIDARRLHFGVKIKDAPHRVEADASRLQQVVWNLLSNAVKFTPEGGCVGLSCEREGDHVFIEVTDSGVGIEPQEVDAIFNAFEQGSHGITRQFGGLGLGLTVAKRLVEMHQGTISVQSAGRNRGATFRVQLPLSRAALEPEREKSVSRPDTLKRRILVVEDNEDTAVTMKMLLDAFGYEVETAGDVTQALKAIEVQRFDLLISDLGLPDKSGFELMQELRRRGNTLKGIALSGYGYDEDVRRSKEAGFTLHLTKPPDPDVLLESIDGIFTPGQPTLGEFRPSHRRPSPTSL